MEGGKAGNHAIPGSGRQHQWKQRKKEREKEKKIFVFPYGFAGTRTPPQDFCVERKRRVCRAEMGACVCVCVRVCKGPIPTSNGGMQNGSSVGICTHCVHVFARLMPTCMLSRCLLTKFLHRSSGGSLLRVCCWLGISICSTLPSPFFCEQNQPTHPSWVRMHIPSTSHRI